MRTIILLAFAYLCTVPLDLNAQLDHEYVMKALDYQEDQDYAKAIVYYSRAIDLKGVIATIPEVYLERASCYFRMKEYRKALYDLDFGLSLDDKNYGLYIQRAMVFYTLVKPDYAIEDFNMALNYVEDDSIKTNILLNLGSAKMMKRDFEGAYSLFNSILEEKPDHVPALTNIGVALNNLGKPNEAFTYLKKALEINPIDPASHVNVGFHFLRQEAFAEAIPHFDKAIELKPKTALAYNNRAFAYMKIGKLENALNDVNKSIKLFPSNAFAYKNRALIFLEMGYREKACQDLYQALDHKFTEQYGEEVEQLILQNCSKE